MAELVQEFRSARIREPFGILWYAPHFEPDLRIRLLNASKESPVILAYIDLNGLKAVNDSMGHNSGDVVLKAYFGALATSLTDRGDAYRLGGDEVGVILSLSSREEATLVVRQVCLLFMSERLRYRESEITEVSIAAGMVITSDPAATVQVLRENADKEMYRAKKFTKNRSPRPSSLAVEGENEIQLFQPVAGPLS